MTSPELIPMEKARSPPRARTARPAATALSASSSWATGTPKTAIIESPMYLSTVPPCSVTTVGQLAEGGIHDPGHHFGIGPFGEGGEADHVGEEDGGQLPLLDGRRARPSPTGRRRPPRTARRRAVHRG